MASMKIKTGATVKVRVGKHKGTIGKVVATLPAKNAVLIEGVGVVKRHIRPSQVNPRGGTKDVHIPMNASKVELVEEPKKKEKK